MTALHLLDANVLIALLVEDHEQHGRAVAWLTQTGTVAACPVTEGALVRFLVRIGEQPRTATALLSALYASDRVAFWPDSLSYVATGLDHVVGHRQVTDAYLAALATAHGGRLATFDEALARALPEQVLLVP